MSFTPPATPEQPVNTAPRYSKSAARSQQRQVVVPMADGALPFNTSSADVNKRDSRSVVAPAQGPVSTSDFGGRIQKPFADEMWVKGDDKDCSFDFREVVKIKDSIRDYAYVELVHLRARVVQVFVHGTSAKAAEGQPPHLFRLGLAPRELPRTSTNSAYGGSVQNPKAMGAKTARLQNFNTSFIVPAAETFEWGAGAIPFPPGMQLDFVAREVRHGYAEFLVLHLVPAEHSKSVLHIQFDGEVACWGQNFC